MINDASPTPHPFLIKICGLSTPETMAAALEAGADLVGLVFHPKSPRCVSMEQARALAEQARGKAGIVALIVDFDASMALALVEALKPDWLQLHGAETPETARAIAAATGLRIIKALPVSTAADLEAVAVHQPSCDIVLLDAKPPRDAAYPGGHGRPFDWDILAHLDARQPFMLSGGLGPDNVGGGIQRIRAMGADLIGVDVSSGVESTPGVKDIAKIASFITAARKAGTEARP